MYPVAAQFGSDVEVTLTPMMIAVGILVSLFTEFVKAIISRWPSITETITKPAFPLLGCACCMGIFALAGNEQWILCGIAVGLMTGGGYDAFKGMAAAKNNIKPIVPLILILCGVLFVAGCADKILTPGEQLEFAMFNVRVQDWNEQCIADPNQCAPGLHNMAAEMQAWNSVIVGDPNSQGVMP